MRLGGILIGLGGILLYLFVPGIWQGFTNTRVREVTFEEFYASDPADEWLVIRHAYVDDANIVRTVVIQNGQTKGAGESFVPVRAGPNDTRPIKLFTSHRRYGADKNDEPGDRKEIPIDEYHTYTLETVRGVKAVGFKLDRDIPGILRSGTLPAAETFIVLRRDHEPQTFVECLAQILIPLGLIALGIWLLRRKKAAAAAASPAPPVPPTA
ncbi:MAG: hypothetical protein KIS92_19750 [Planctomycetota bacterium]|nr:hypothetical protein [Planctomycetota bacterium]